MASLWVRFGAAGAALAVTLAAHAHIPVASVADEAEFRALHGSVGRIATLGFETLVADYRWLQAVQIVGHEHANLVESAPAVGALVEAVVELDPFADHPYRFASLWLVNDVDQVLDANRILERGIAYHPDDWRNRFYLSFNHFFYLHEVERAAAELERAVDLPSSPKYIGRLLARLRSEESGSLEPARAYLEELLRQNEDPWKQAEYEKALDEIATEERARFLDQAREVFRQRNGRDITRVEELAEGASAVLRELPPELHGWGWVLDAKTDRIMSAYYMNRYEVHLNPRDRERRDSWARRSAEAKVESER